jgi:hypothetical protein
MAESNPDNVYVKATNEHMCGYNAFQYEFGRVYRHVGLVLCCHAGFHCCDELRHISEASDYHMDGCTRYFIVRAWGNHSYCSMGGSMSGEERHKHAFEYMELVTELKYKTLEQVEQAMADIKYMFRDQTKRDANVAQFLYLQANLPSSLKKRVKTMRSRTVVLKNVNLGPEMVIVITHRPGAAKSCRTMRSGDPTAWEYIGKPLQECARVDVYHHEHEPVLGLCPKDAKVLCDKYSS